MLSVLVLSLPHWRCRYPPPPPPPPPAALLPAGVTRMIYNHGDESSSPSMQIQSSPFIRTDPAMITTNAARVTHVFHYLGYRRGQLTRSRERPRTGENWGLSGRGTRTSPAARDVKRHPLIDENNDAASPGIHTRVRRLTMGPCTPINPRSLREPRFNTCPP